MHGLRADLQRHNRAILCDFIENPNFNAVAMVLGEKEYIGIFHGFTWFSMYVIFTMLSDPEMFPEIGDCSKEVLSHERYSWLKNSAHRDAFFHCCELPKCPIRAEAAQHILHVAHIFLYFHEFCHLDLCHVHLLREEFLTEAYEEFSAFPLSEAEEYLRQVFELQADQGGALTSLKHGREFWASMSWGNHKNSLDADTLWAAAVDTILNIRQYVRHVRGTRSSATHPNATIRWANIYISTTTPRAEESGLQSVNSDLTFRKHTALWFSKYLLDGTPMFLDAEKKNALPELFRIWRNFDPYKDRLTQLQIKCGGYVYKWLG